MLVEIDRYTAGLIRQMRSGQVTRIVGNQATAVQGGVADLE